MTIHAAGESVAPGEPITPGTFAIALAAPSQAALEAHEARLAAGLPPGSVHAIREDCGPYAGQLMAIGLRPAPRSTLRRWISSIPLLR